MAQNGFWYRTFQPISLQYGIYVLTQLWVTTARDLCWKENIPRGSYIECRFIWQSCLVRLRRCRGSISPGTSPTISNSHIIPSFLSLLPAYGLRYDLSVSASCSGHHACCQPCPGPWWWRHLWAPSFFHHNYLSVHKTKENIRCCIYHNSVWLVPCTPASRTFLYLWLYHHSTDSCPVMRSLIACFHHSDENLHWVISHLWTQRNPSLHKFPKSWCCITATATTKITNEEWEWQELNDTFGNSKIITCVKVILGVKISNQSILWKHPK